MPVAVVMYVPTSHCGRDLGDRDIARLPWLGLAVIIASSKILLLLMYLEPPLSIGTVKREHTETRVVYSIPPRRRCQLNNPHFHLGDVTV